MHLMSGKGAIAALCALSFAESSFFPIPPDILMIPLILKQRDKAFRIAFLCTLFSVIGGAFGYIIGCGLYDVFAVPFLAYIYSRKIAFNRKGSYMNGANYGDNRSFVDSFGERKTLWLSNHYYKDLVGKRKLMKPAQILTAAVLLVMMVYIIGGALS